MARPKSVQPRDQQLNIALRRDELERICTSAKAEGKRPTSYARDRLLEGESSPPQAGADRALYEQVKRIGVNLNQIARQLNALGRTSVTELELVLREVRDFLRRMG